jgi:hypothetical protein
MSPLTAQFLLGAICMAALTASAFFLRFWRVTQDRFFLFVAASFCLEALSRAVLAFSAHPREGDPQLYIIRCIAYGLILVGIWDKNRRH